MRTFAGISMVLLLEFTAVGAFVLWRWKRSAARAADTRHLTAVLEVEDGDSLLPVENRRLPLEILAELRRDPMLGLADVQVVQHVQPTGAGLPERSQVGRSYQTLNEEVARNSSTALEAKPEPVPALRLTWIALRLELPGSRNTRWANRAAGPIEARGGGPAGAAKTMDKAVRTAAARLTAAGFQSTKLAGEEILQELATSYGVVTEADLAAGPGGVLAGVDPAHRPVVLGLFNRRPLTVYVVGGLHLAQLLALRSAAVGARIIVETARDDAWDSLVIHSGLDADRLVVQPIGRVVGTRRWSPASPTAPVFILRDCGARPPYASLPRGPWTTVVTLLPYLDVRTAGQLGAADLAGLQRVPPEEAEIAQVALGLPPADVAVLPELPDTLTMWRANGRSSRYCEAVPTAWETGIIGDPVR